MNSFPVRNMKSLICQSFPSPLFSISFQANRTASQDHPQARPAAGHRRPTASHNIPRRPRNFQEDENYVGASPSFLIADEHI